MLFRSAMSTVDRRLLADISSFLHQHDRIGVGIVEKLAVEAIRAVEEGRADVGICWEGAHTRFMNCTSYHDDSVCLVVGQGHGLAGRESVTFSEVLDHDLVDIAPGCIMSMRMHREAAQLGKRIRSRIQVNTFDAALNAIRGGLGITVMPAGMVGDDARLRLIPIEDVWTRRHVVLCTKEGSEMTLPTRLFVEYLCSGNRPTRSNPDLRVSLLGWDLQSDEETSRGG